MSDDVKIIAQKGSDKMEISILPDGSLKVTTGKISMANHGGAEALLKELYSGMGGDVQRNKKGLGHHHHHEHLKQ